MIVNITTEQSHYNVYTIIILLFFVGLCDRANHGPALGLRYEIVLQAGPGHTFCGPGPGLIIHFACRAGACMQNCCGPRPGLGIKSYLRAGPGPRFQARAGPYHPPPRNANNVEPYTFVTLFSGKADTPTPHCVT